MDINILRVEPGSALAARLLAFVEESSWDEVKAHTTRLLREYPFPGWEAMFAALDRDRIVGHATFLKEDYYPLPEIYPWISTLFVTEEYRGKGICGLLIEAVNRYAKAQGFTRTYIPSSFTGLYERYGYRRVRDIINYGGDTDHLYVKDI